MTPSPETSTKTVESARPAPKSKKTGEPSAGKASKSDEAEDDPADSAKSKDKAETKEEKKKNAGKTAAAKAATLLRLGRTLERTGKTDQALANYKQVVKDFPKTPSAKTAAERIKELEVKE